MTDPLNPPAFPLALQHDASPFQEGISTRDYFAAAALTTVIKVCAGDTAARSNPEQYFATKCYAIADAMLAHRGVSK